MINQLITEANSLSLSGKFEDAIKLLEQCLDSNPGQHDILLLLWKNYLAAGDHNKAEQVFNGVCDACDDPETLRAIGNMLQKSGDTAMAVTVYRKYLELRPGNKAVWRRLTALYHAAGNIEVAINCYHRIIELEPDNASIGAEFSRLLFLQKRPDEAEAVLVGVLENNPDDLDICFLYAGLLVRAGKLGEALNYSTKVLETVPSNMKYQLVQADIYERLGEVYKAFDVIKPLLEDKNVPLEAVRIFAMISPALRMKYQAGLLLDYISGRGETTVPERETINAIRDWLARS